MKCALTAILAVLALMLTACGYRIPEGDKHPEVRDFEEFTSPNAVVSLRRLTPLDESVIDFHRPEGSRFGYAITATKDESAERVETLRIFDEVGKEKFVPVRTIGFGSRLYVDREGRVYFGRLRFDPPEFRPQKIGCVIFSVRNESVEFSDRYRDCEVIAFDRIEEFLRRIDSVVVARDNFGRGFWYRAKDGTIAEFDDDSLRDDHIANAKFHAAMKSYLRVDEVAYEDPPVLVRYDESIVGNLMGGNHMAMYFTPKTIQYYRARVADHIWNFKLGSKQAWGRIKAYESPQGGQFMDVYRSQYSGGGYDSALYLVSGAGQSHQNAPARTP